MNAAPRLDLDQIASQADVPKTTVWQMLFSSRSELNAGDIARVQAVLHQMDSSLAVQRTGSRTGTVLVIVPQRIGLSDYATRVLQVFRRAADQHKLEVCLYAQAEDQVPDLNCLLSAFDVVMMVLTQKTEGLVQSCFEAGRPYVMVECDYDGVQDAGRKITVDNSQAAQSVMQHLLELGHRRIGFITGLWHHPSSLDRLAAYRAALQEAGIDPLDAWVEKGDWIEDSGYRAARALLNLRERPTAIFAANDLMAFGAIRAAKECGLDIPGEVSIAGFDDIVIAAEFSPPLTTVRQHSEAIGQIAFEAVWGWLQGSPPAELETILLADLIARGSTGPAPRD
jgi:LacI family transcriptional regulator